VLRYSAPDARVVHADSDPGMVVARRTHHYPDQPR
jgi:hypothetical protein